MIFFRSKGKMINKKKINKILFYLSSFYFIFKKNYTCTTFIFVLRHKCKLSGKADIFTELF